MKKLFYLFLVSLSAALNVMAAHAPKSDNGLFLSPGQRFD